VFLRDLSKYRLGVPLKQSFRFAHEPIHQAGAMPFIGRQAELNAFIERILFSNGGSFLLTGYRGVGKTSFVNQTIEALEKLLPWAETYLGKTELLAVHLNMARPLQPAELMHHIIRRLYDKLLEKNIFPNLDPELQEQLTLAYHRTSVNMTRTVSDGKEGNLGLSEVTIDAGAFKTTLKPSLGYKQTRSQNYQAVFLGYDDKAAEYDVIEIARRLTTGYTPPRLRNSRLQLRRNSRQFTRIKIIFVFDEMDKLEEFFVETNGSQQLFIDHLLSHLKNLFTTSGISFVFVAGKDLHERWLDDLGRGDSIYESVFSYDKYLPCMWADVNQICESFVDYTVLPDQPALHSGECPRCAASTIAFRMFCHQCGAYLLDVNETRALFEDFKKYLAYKGRGLPRRIIRGFNEYVQWNDQRPILVFTHQEIRRIRFYAGLQDLLAENLPKLFGTVAEESIGSQEDKQRLGIYYLIDWMLQRGQRSFSLSDAIRASEQLSKKVALAAEVAPQLLNNIIEILNRDEYLEEVKPSPDQVQVVEASAKSEKIYRLPLRRLNEIAGSTDAFEEEAHSLDSSRNVPTRIGRYRIQEEIGQGGMAIVYRAIDTQSNQEVALKLTKASSNASDAQIIKYFKREAEILKLLEHPNIVRYHDSGDADGQFYIAMEYVDGTNLSLVLSKHGRLATDLALHIFKPLLQALQYVHEQGFIWNDIKPANVLLSRSGKVYLTDSGVTKAKQKSTQSTQIIAGTPTYMAPERYTYQSDERSDIYALGVTFYEVITGTLPSNSLSDEIIPPSQLVQILPTLEEIILKCLAKHPQRRYQSVHELTLALNSLPMQQVEHHALGSILEKTLHKSQYEGRDLPTEVPRGNENTMFPTVFPLPPIQSAPIKIESDQPQQSTNDTVVAETLSTILNDANLSDNAFLISKPEGVTYRVAKSAETTLGRDARNDIQLEHPKVSRFHARIIAENDRYYLEDLNSIQGTKVNQSRIRGRYELHHQDKIQIARFAFEFQVREP
jgi:serine/threonine protein kinase/Cdc6-like AAA superfamily ATPase